MVKLITTKNLLIMKSKLVAYLLWFFLGIFSVHRFYLGKIGSGILYLLTGQLLGIGWLVDLFILGGMVDSYNNKNQINELSKEQYHQSRFNEAVTAKITSQEE